MHPEWKQCSHSNCFTDSPSEKSYEFEGETTYLPLFIFAPSLQNHKMNQFYLPADRTGCILLAHFARYFHLQIQNRYCIALHQQQERMNRLIRISINHRGNVCNVFFGHRRRTGSIHVVQQLKSAIRVVKEGFLWPQDFHKNWMRFRKMFSKTAPE